MCKWGTSVPVAVTIPAHLSHTGEARQAVKDVDACIAELVKALNVYGVTTVASCCGHLRGFGNIALADGRELLICPDYETARKLDKLFPDIHGRPQPDAGMWRCAACEHLNRDDVSECVNAYCPSHVENQREAIGLGAVTEALKPVWPPS